MSLASTKVDEVGHEQMLEDEGHFCQLLLGGLLIIVDRGAAEEEELEEEDAAGLVMKWGMRLAHCLQNHW